MKNKVKLILILLTLTSILILSNPVPAQEHDYKPNLWSKNSQMTWYIHRAYGYDVDTVILIGQHIGNDDDVAVCLNFARRRQFDPRDVMGLKRKGQSWKAIIKALSIDASKLFTEAGIYDIFGVPGCYKHSYGELKKWKQDPSYEMDLSDEEVRDLVHLAFVVRTFGSTPINIMRQRNSGKSWTSIILNQGR